MFTVLLLCLLGYVGYQLYVDPLGKGLFSFLFYLQIAGLFKRLLFHFEPFVIEAIGYNFIVGIQYILFSCLVFSSIRRDAFNRLTKKGLLFFIFRQLHVFLSTVIKV